MLLKKVAIELNNGRKGKCLLSLIIELDEKPKDLEAFLKIVDVHCKDSYKEWIFVEVGNPAIIMAVGILNEVKLDFYYNNFGGVQHTLEIKEL